ncbi:DUF3019 domain-containing protein [Thalassotalea sp. G2M2-11]|uniref:DUF3019 domain-containing protein n=1 Tax=Thalassotalea sp. G2M2-11 TaxID=2787627 RepID=UPI0019D1F4D3|nr:DUF3019 domain-containing protein [Thalassotalea sp. G2M2-11]
MRQKHLQQLHFFLFFFIVTYGNNALAANGKALQVTPQICVVAQGEKRCQTVVDIQYHTDHLADYCIVIATYHIRRCYQQVQQLQLQVDVKTENSLEIEVQEQHSNAVIAHTTMDVVMYKRKETRKRRNFGWNFL